MSHAPPCEILNLGATRVAVAQTGNPDGPRVICLHAVGHGMADFWPLIARLGDRFRFILLDWPGHGESPADALPCDAKRYAEILNCLIDQLGDQPVILLGNSIGGAAAIISAAARPARIRGLVLCNSGGLVPVSWMVRGFCRVMHWFFTAGMNGARWYPRAYSLYYRLVLPTAQVADRRQQIVDQGQQCARQLAEAWASFATPAADLRSLADKIRCPVWIAWARGDRVIPWMFVRAAVSGFTDHEISFFNGGHSAFMEDPDAFAQKLEAFVLRLA